MNHRKWVHNFFFYTLVSIGFVLVALMATSDAHASERDDNDTYISDGNGHGHDHITTATERTTDTLTRVVETCSDCYGQKVK